jgi:CBS domain-containing protein
MKVFEILRVKESAALFTVAPDVPMLDAVNIMAEKDVGSLIVTEHGRLSGMLTFREVMSVLHAQGGQLGNAPVRDHMNRMPLTISSETDIDDVRRQMLEHHARYVPVVDEGVLAGVISFYDVAKAVIESQDYENKMLKGYSRTGRRRWVSRMAAWRATQDCTPCSYSAPRLFKARRD